MEVAPTKLCTMGYHRHSRFCHIVPGRSLKYLVLPEQFVTQHMPHPPSVLVLTTGDGMDWPTKLEMLDGSLAITDGWSCFIAFYEFEPADVLIFAYDGVSRCLVTIFDTVSACEKILPQLVDGFNPADAYDPDAHKQAASGVHINQTDEPYSPTDTLPVWSSKQRASFNGLVEETSNYTAFRSTPRSTWSTGVKPAVATPRSPWPMSVSSSDMGVATKDMKVKHRGQRKRMARSNNDKRTLPRHDILDTTPSQYRRQRIREAHTGSELAPNITFELEELEIIPDSAESFRYTDRHVFVHVSPPALVDTAMLPLPLQWARNHLDAGENGRMFRIRGQAPYWNVTCVLTKSEAFIGNGWRAFASDNGIEPDGGCAIEVCAEDPLVLHGLQRQLSKLLWCPPNLYLNLISA